MARLALPAFLALSLPAHGEGKPLIEQAHEHWKDGRFHAATDILRPLAARGNPVAQFYMGEATRLGLGSEVNPENAITWYKMAIRQGFAPAENTMAVWLLENKAENILIPRLLIRAAQRGYAPAQYNLCRLYATGEQIEKDSQRALWWCNKAAMQGHAGAQQAMALAREHGIGTGNDGEQRWLPPDPKGGQGTPADFPKQP